MAKEREGGRKAFELALLSSPSSLFFFLLFRVVAGNMSRRHFFLFFSGLLFVDSEISCPFNEKRTLFLDSFEPFEAKHPSAAWVHSF